MSTAIATGKGEMPMPTPPGVPPDGPVAASTEGAKPPKYGTARPADPTARLPRAVDPLERAVPGTVRVKVACRNYVPQPVCYVLAKAGEKAEADAAAVYLKESGLGRELDRLRKVGKTVEEPELVFTVLPD